jgi:Leucine-rich repeat (LRR) protein
MILIDIILWNTKYLNRQKKEDAQMTYLYEIEAKVLEDYKIRVETIQFFHQFLSQEEYAKIEWRTWLPDECRTEEEYSLNLEYEHWDIIFSLDKQGYIDDIRIEVNEIKEIPFQIKYLPHLTGVFIILHGSPDFPTILCDLYQLKHLTINYHYDINEQIKNPLVIPSMIANLRQLEELDLSDCQIHSLPPEICTLSHLKELNLSNNELPTLPKNFGDLLNLEVLRLEDNQISELPESMRHLQKLQQLCLLRNKMKVIPEWIGDLKNLIGLNLEHNDITIIPQSLENLHKLKYLNLSNNKIQTLPEIFGSMPDFDELDMSHNQLSVLPHSLANCQNLRSLDVEYNSISHVPEVYKKLVNMQKLEVGNNLFEEIPEFIQNFHELERISFESCKLKDVPNFLIALPKIFQSQIFLANNPFINLVDIKRRFPHTPFYD